MNGIDRFLYDTDIIIDYLKGDQKAKEILEEEEGKQSISVITVSELYAGVRNEKEKLLIKNLVDYFDVFAISKEIAERGGLLKKQYNKSHNVTLPDALIAATVIEHSLELKTLNIKHYPMIKGIKGAYKKEL